MDSNLVLSLLLGSVGVYLSTEIVKYVKAIPINEGQKARIRSVAVGLSTVSTVVVTALNGELNPKEVQGWLVQLAGLALTWGSAEGMHRLRNFLDKSSQ
jgi:hypothetical protein